MLRGDALFAEPKPLVDGGGVPAEHSCAVASILNAQARRDDASPPF